MDTALEFVYRLAKDLSKTVSELGATMSWREFQSWVEFYCRESRAYEEAREQAKHQRNASQMAQRMINGT